jgi:hypothetical protein
MNQEANEIFKSWVKHGADLVVDCQFCEQELVISERNFKSRRNSGKGIACEECSGELLPLTDEVDDWQNIKQYGSIWEDETNNTDYEG